VGIVRGLCRRAAGAATAGALVATFLVTDGYAAGRAAVSGEVGTTDRLDLRAAAGDTAGPDRRVVRYTVRRGDTATGLAVRFHAWTAELVRLNRLGPAAHLVAGQRLRIPVVVSAARADRRGRHAEVRPHGLRKRTSGANAHRHARPGRPSRARVRTVLVRTARAYDVDPHLALAVSWQEAGWQMHHVSTANAVGAMQVLPTTGRWMSAYVGRPLRLHRLRDNAAAGVMLLRVLRDQAPLRRAVAGYYQGLAGVRAHGMYPDTRRYVRNVLALRRLLQRGWDPS
jgi:hypothetical protein